MIPLAAGLQAALRELTIRYYFAMTMMVTGWIAFAASLFLLFSLIWFLRRLRAYPELRQHLSCFVSKEFAWLNPLRKWGLARRMCLEV